MDQNDERDYAEEAANQRILETGDGELQPHAVKGYNDGPLMDPTEVIRILAAEIAQANSREALGGYFDHLAGDQELTKAIDAYSGILLTIQGDVEDDI